MKDKIGLSLKEKRITNNFLPLELSHGLEIKYPSQKIQEIFKLNGNPNWFRKKKQEERQKKGK